MNGLVLVLEGARADHMSCDGCERETTPFLDDLARQRVGFAHASSAAASAFPAMASLLSGLFPRAHGATEESGVLPAGPSTLAELRGGAGYRTAAFSAAATVSPATGCDRGFESFDNGGSGGRVRGRAAALRRALFTWLSDTEQWMRDRALDGTVDAVPTAARRAAVE